MGKEEWREEVGKKKEEDRSGKGRRKAGGGREIGLSLKIEELEEKTTRLLHWSRSKAMRAFLKGKRVTYL